MKLLSPQDWVAIGQLVVALLMLWSLIQSGKNLDYTRVQIEAAKSPSIEVESFVDDKVHLLNSGGSETEQFQIVGYVGAHYQVKTEEITRVSISAASLKSGPIHGKLKPGEKFTIPFQKLTFASPGKPADPDVCEAFAVVLRYYRTADRRPFFKIVSFMRTESDRVPANEYLYFPLHVAPGSAIGGPNRSVFIKLRKGLRDLCIDNFDLSINSDYP